MTEKQTVREKIRVAFFIDSIGFGGAEKSLVAQLSRLRFDVLDVDLYTMAEEYDDPGALALIPRDVHLRHIPAPAKSLRQRICRIGYSLKIRLLPRIGIHRHLPQLYWESMGRTYPVVAQPYDVAIAYQQGMMTYYVAEKVKAKTKIAWVNSQLGAHGHDVAFSRRFYDRYDHVVAVCDTLGAILASAGYADPSKLSTIHDIIDARDLTAKALEPCDIDDSHEWTLLTVARLSPEKNIPLAIEAARILKENGIDFRWHFVGEGAILLELIEKAACEGVAGNVVFAGKQENPYKYMSRADIYVLTSRSEGFGMSVAEAKILGCPVVSTDFPMVGEQIVDGHNGLIARMTPQSVAGKIMQLISDDELRRRIKRNLSAERNDTAITEPEKLFKLITHDNQ